MTRAHHKSEGLHYYYCNVFIFRWKGKGCLICYINIVSVVALDETNISSYLHFSMQNIEMSCD